MTPKEEQKMFRSARLGAAVGAITLGGFGIYTATKTPLSEYPKDQLATTTLAIALLALSGAITGAISFGFAARCLGKISASRAITQSPYQTSLLKDNPDTSTRKNTADSDDLDADLEKMFQTAQNRMQKISDNQEAYNGVDEEEYEKNGFSIVNSFGHTRV